MHPYPLNDTSEFPALNESEIELISAIKAYRKRTGHGLADSKDVVDEYIAKRGPFREKTIPAETGPGYLYVIVGASGIRGFVMPDGGVNPNVDLIGATFLPKQFGPLERETFYNMHPRFERIQFAGELVTVSRATRFAFMSLDGTRVIR